MITKLVNFYFFSDKRKQEELPIEENSSPKRKRHSPSPGPQSSSSSESDNEKPVSAFYRSLLESSYAHDGKNTNFMY